MDSIELERLLRFGLKVSYYRKIRSMSIDELAEKTGLSVSMIQKVESPTLPKGVSLNALWRLSDALNVHVAMLLNDD